MSKVRAMFNETLNELRQECWEQANLYARTCADLLMSDFQVLNGVELAKQRARRAQLALEYWDLCRQLT